MAIVFIQLWQYLEHAPLSISSCRSTCLISCQMLQIHEFSRRLFVFHPDLPLVRTFLSYKFVQKGFTTLVRRDVSPHLTQNSDSCSTSTSEKRCYCSLELNFRSFIPFWLCSLLTWICLKDSLICTWVCYFRERRT